MTDITIHPDGSYTVNQAMGDTSKFHRKWIEHKGCNYLIYYQNKSQDAPNPYVNMILGGRCRCGYLNKDLCRGDALIAKSVDYPEFHYIDCTWNDIENLYNMIEEISCEQHYSTCGCIIL